jgi:hypothetical protein
MAVQTASDRGAQSSESSAASIVVAEHVTPNSRAASLPLVLLLCLGVGTLRGRPSPSAGSAGSTEGGNTAVGNIAPSDLPRWWPQTVPHSTRFKPQHTYLSSLIDPAASVGSAAHAAATDRLLLCADPNGELLDLRVFERYLMIAKNFYQAPYTPPKLLYCAFSTD